MNTPVDATVALVRAEAISAAIRGMDATTAVAGLRSLVDDPVVLAEARRACQYQVLLEPEVVAAAAVLLGAAAMLPHDGALSPSRSRAHHPAGMRTAGGPRP